jgi:death-on-curing protein
MPGEHASSVYAACARPFQTAFGEDLYFSPFEKAAALFHSIICDHAFVDGNKRTATVGAIGALAAEGVIELEDATPLQVRMLGEVALETASAGMTVNQIAHWLRRIFDDSLLAQLES